MRQDRIFRRDKRSIDHKKAEKTAHIHQGRDARLIGIHKNTERDSAFDEVKERRRINHVSGIHKEAYFRTEVIIFVFSHNPRAHACRLQKPRLW